MTDYGGMMMQMPPPVKVTYSPYEIIDFKYSKFGQKKSSEPIMYDPSKAKGYKLGQGG
jgi:hypothetical protein